MTRALLTLHEPFIAPDGKPVRMLWGTVGDPMMRPAGAPGFYTLPADDFAAGIRIPLGMAVLQPMEHPPLSPIDDVWNVMTGTRIEARKHAEGCNLSQPHRVPEDCARNRPVHHLGREVKNAEPPKAPDYSHAVDLSDLSRTAWTLARRLDNAIVNCPACAKVIRCAARKEWGTACAEHGLIAKDPTEDSPPGAQNTMEIVAVVLAGVLDGIRVEDGVLRVPDTQYTPDHLRALNGSRLHRRTGDPPPAPFGLDALAAWAAKGWSFDSDAESFAATLGEERHSASSPAGLLRSLERWAGDGRPDEE